MCNFNATIRYCLSTNADFVRVKTPAYNGYFKQQFFRDHFENSPRESVPDRLTRWFNTGHSLKAGKKTSVCRSDGPSPPVIIKRYNPRGWVNALRQTCGRTRAVRTWTSAHVLRRIQLATPEPLACVEIKHRGLVTESYVVTECFPGDSLYLYIAKYWPAEEAWRSIVLKMTGMLELMGQHGITHGDLKHSNIMINDSDLALIDLDSVQVHRSRLLFQMRRAKDLRMFKNRLSKCEIKGPPRFDANGAGHSP